MNMLSSGPSQAHVRRFNAEDVTGFRWPKQIKNKQSRRGPARIFGPLGAKLDQGKEKEQKEDLGLLEFGFVPARKKVSN